MNGSHGLMGVEGDGCIEKKYRFKSFVRAMVFVNAVGYVANHSITTRYFIHTTK